MYKAIDLFCGAGGLSLGLKSAGFNVIASIENDPIAAKTYRNNFGDYILENSITEVNPKELIAQLGLKPGECDLLAGGPPCQGFSVQRRGDDLDSRNHLVLEYVRFVEEIKPKFFLMENVKGLMSKRGKPYFDELVNRASSLGYKVKYAKINAADFGVPQERTRVFLIGQHMDSQETQEFFFPESALKPNQYTTVRQTIGDLPTPPLDGKPHPEYPLHYREARLSKVNLERFQNLPEGGARENLPEHLQLPCHVNNPSHRHKDVYGRMYWDKPSVTLTARFDSFSRGRFGHPVEHRTITLREGARLQSFPDTFHFEGNRADVARQIGNAVPPKLAEVLGRQIISTLN